MNYETKMIIGGRQVGKTTKLIEHSAKTGYTIVCMNHNNAKLIKDRATKMNLSIPEPIVLNRESIKNEDVHNMIKETKGILIDDFGYLINNIFDGKYAGCTCDSLWAKDIEVLGGVSDHDISNSMKNK